jgi:threonine synthase
MSFELGLRCRDCGKQFASGPLNGCDECFAPLEVVYDLEAVGRAVSPAAIAARAPGMWRYRELLPQSADSDQSWLARASGKVGWTPLTAAPRLAEALGARELYLKNESVNFPTLSFKDRVVSVALRKAMDFGFRVVACSSTGNLANAVAAQAAALGLEAYIFVPAELEAAKIAATLVYGARLVRIAGNYDHVNRLCSEIAQKYPWGIVNVNLRAYYAEGSKTVGYEIAEQLGWRIPAAIVCPMAGGALINKIAKAFGELRTLGWAGGECAFFGAQASGCSPISTAVKSGSDEICPQRPNTIARSLAIGNPADGFYAARVIRETGGWAEDATDPEIVAGMRLLAETEGIFTETAGGVTVACAGKLIREGKLDARGPIVLAITGNGLKTLDAVPVETAESPVLAPRLREFDSWYEGVARTAAAACVPEYLTRSA